LKTPTTSIASKISVGCWVPWVATHLPFLLGCEDPVHVLVNQFHVADSGLHQAGLLLDAFGGHLEAPLQFVG